MTNPKWVEAGARAWMERSTDQSNAAWQNARLRAAIFVGGAEEAIRADEREKKMAAADIAFLDAIAARERLADIATKVEALATRGVGARVIDGELVTYALVERDEVLALFEEAQDD